MYYNPARIEKDLARDAEHRAKRDNLAVPAQASLSPAAAAGTSPSPTPPAASAISTPPPPSKTASTSPTPADSAGTEPSSSAQPSDVSADPPQVAVTLVEHPQEINLEAIEIVHATAVIEDCPTEKCDYKEIYDIVTKEQHMRANITTVNIDHQSTRKFRSNLFTHTLSIVLTVKTAALWDSPRQYVSKHLGQSDWKTTNGTSIKFVKITVKRKFTNPFISLGWKFISKTLII